MKKIESSNNDILKVLVAVLLGGAGWSVDSQMTVITFVAVAVVWLARFVSQRYKLDLGKAWLTGFLFVLAVCLSLIFTPVALPELPMWTGSLAAFVPLLIAYLGAFLEIAGPVVASATLIYNILLEHVLEKLSAGVTASLPPPASGDKG